MKGQGLGDRVMGYGLGLRKQRICVSGQGTGSGLPEGAPPVHRATNRPGRGPRGAGGVGVRDLQ